MVMSAPESFMGKEIAAKRAEFDSWVETQIKQLRIDRDQHERSMENLNGKNSRKEFWRVITEGGRWVNVSNF